MSELRKENIQLERKIVKERTLNKNYLNIINENNKQIEASKQNIYNLGKRIEACKK